MLNFIQPFTCYSCFSWWQLAKFPGFIFLQGIKLFIHGLNPFRVFYGFFEVTWFMCLKAVRHETREICTGGCVYNFGNRLSCFCGVVSACHIVFVPGWCLGCSARPSKDRLSFIGYMITLIIVLIFIIKRVILTFIKSILSYILCVAEC